VPLTRLVMCRILDQVPLALHLSGKRDGPAIAGTTACLSLIFTTPTQMKYVLYCSCSALRLAARIV
jgi:hypothetical protein